MPFASIKSARGPRRHLRAELFASIALFCAGVQATRAANVVVPPGDGAAEAALLNRLPFATSADVADGSVRYQQVFAGGAFGFAGPVTISQINFRPDSSTAAAFSLNDPNIRIDLSTTAAAPDALSATFSKNVGADNKTVFSGSLSLSTGNAGNANGPRAFDLTVTLTTPFTFNPASGNLLLDVRNFAPSNSDGSLNFDADATFGDSTSRIFANDVNAATADVTDSIGLVTQFGYGAAGTSVPLPIALFATIPAMGLSIAAGKKLQHLS